MHKDIHVVQYVNVCNIITIIYMLPSSTDLGSDSCMLSTMRLHLKGGGHMMFFETSLIGILGRGNKESSFRGSHFRLTRREKRRSLRGTCLCPYQYIRELSGSHPSHSIPSYPVLSTKKTCPCCAEDSCSLMDCLQKFAGVEAGKERSKRGFHIIGTYPCVFSLCSWVTTCFRFTEIGKVYWNRLFR